MNSMILLRFSLSIYNSVKVSFHQSQITTKQQILPDRFQTIIFQLAIYSKQFSFNFILKNVVEPRYSRNQLRVSHWKWQEIRNI